MGLPNRCRILLPVVSLALLLAAIMAGGPAPAHAATPLSVSVAGTLSSITAPVEVSFKGTLPSPVYDATVAAIVRGPGLPRSGTGNWPVAARVDQRLGTVAAEFDLSLIIPADSLMTPGAYEVTVEFTPLDGVTLTGRCWLGRLADPPAEVDLAMVWPVALGVHQDPDGAFVDSTIQSSLAGPPDSPGSVLALISLADALPDWHFTLAVDPAYLDQVLDISAEVSKDSTVAAQALRVLDMFRLVARADSTQVIPIPYANPAYTLLASERWTEGVDQMRLAKASLQQVLGLPAAPDGAYAPGLDLTTQSIAYFSRASIDYAVASEDVTADLAEEPENPLAPLRIQDVDGNRLSLLPASRHLRATVASPWEVELFLATLAAELGSGKTGPFVVAPAEDFGIPPSTYLRSLGEQLGRLQWLNTLTLEELVQTYPPGTRPIVMSRYGAPLEGFVDQSMMESLRTTHSAFSDLEQAAGPGASPLSSIRLLLYLAESRYWMAPGTSPQVANIGLSYQDAVNRRVRAEFDKVQVVPGQSVTVKSGEGQVPVVVRNDTGYPMKVQVEMSGAGVDVSNGGSQAVELAPGINTVTYTLGMRGSRAAVKVTLAAGNTVVAAGDLSYGPSRSCGSSPGSPAVWCCWSWGHGWWCAGCSAVGDVRRLPLVLEAQQHLLDAAVLNEVHARLLRDPACFLAADALLQPQACGARRGCFLGHVRRRRAAAEHVHDVYRPIDLCECGHARLTEHGLGPGVHGYDVIPALDQVTHDLVAGAPWVL